MITILGIWACSLGSAAKTDLHRDLTVPTLELMVPLLWLERGEV